MIRGGHERRAGVGRLLGHDLDVGEGGQGCGSQERVGCRRRKSRSLQLGRVDGHPCDGQGIGGTTLREHAEVPLDERGGAVELAVEGRGPGAERREEQHADDREQGEIRVRAGDAAGMPGPWSGRRARTIGAAVSAAAGSFTPGSTTPV